MRRRIVKRTEITERIVGTESAGGTVSGQETYRVSIVRDEATGSREVYRSEPIAEIEIDESINGIFSLKGKAKRIL